ncbi:hypothetical protein BJ085DRAFT_8505, partial [Dimargaris cristalligena]
LLKYHGIRVHLYDYELLSPKKWLNYTLMDLYYCYLKQKFLPNINAVALLRPVLAYRLTRDLVDDPNLMADLPKELTRAELIFIPVNDNNVHTKAAEIHWSLLVYSRTMGKFYHYDPLGKHNLAMAKMVHKNLTGLLRIGDTEFVSLKVPNQKASFDCGIYVIMFTEALLRR